jgi:hypothetical protein
MNLRQSCLVGIKLGLDRVCVCNVGRTVDILWHQLCSYPITGILADTGEAVGWRRGRENRATVRGLCEYVLDSAGTGLG